MYIACMVQKKPPLVPHNCQRYRNAKADPEAQQLALRNQQNLSLPKGTVTPRPTRTRKPVPFVTSKMCNRSWASRSGPAARPRPRRTAAGLAVCLGAVDRPGVAGAVGPRGRVGTTAEDDRVAAGI